MDWESINRMIEESDKRFPTIDLDTKKGSEVVFSYPENGRECDVLHAAKHLVVDRTYTVEAISIGNSTSSIELKELKGVEFNTVQFSNKQEAF